MRSWRRLGRLALVTVMLAACAAPPTAPAVPARNDLFTLLPTLDSRPGALSVTHEGREQVLETPYAAARIRAPGQLETGTVTTEEVQAVFGDALGALPPRPATFTLYFLSGRDEFTPESRQVMTAIFTEIARRPVPDVVVTGHTDRLGAEDFNDALSLQRAERVRTELVRLGMAPERIAVAGRGWREPVVPAPEGVAEPRNRRVEITVR